MSATHREGDEVLSTAQRECTSASWGAACVFFYARMNALPRYLSVHTAVHPGSESVAGVDDYNSSVLLCVLRNEHVLHLMVPTIATRNPNLHVVHPRNCSWFRFTVANHKHPQASNAPRELQRCNISNPNGASIGIHVYYCSYSKYHPKRYISRYKSPAPPFMSSTYIIILTNRFWCWWHE